MGWSLLEHAFPSKFIKASARSKTYLGAPFPANSSARSQTLPHRGRDSDRPRTQPLLFDFSYHILYPTSKQWEAIMSVRWALFSLLSAALVPAVLTAQTQGEVTGQI